MTPVVFNVSRQSADGADIELGYSEYGADKAGAASVSINNTEVENEGKKSMSSLAVDPRWS